MRQKLNHCKYGTILREMTDIVTLDGPTSSGKNSVGFLLAKKLGFVYIDTGMIYRAGCIKMIKEGVDPKDTEKIENIYKNLDIQFESKEGEWKMFLDHEDLTEKLHTPEISSLVHEVAAIPSVREIVRNIQKSLAGNGKVVVGGRDIGSEIFPDAKNKFFLTASIEVRARRRFNQLIGKDPSTKLENVLKDMEERDKHDSTREASPMRVPDGAIIIDNTNMTIEETVDKMLTSIK